MPIDIHDRPFLCLQDWIGKRIGMKAVNVTASASSSGDVECYVTGSLTAKASSSGEVAYKGNPKDIDFSPKRGLRKME